MVVSTRKKVEILEEGENSDQTFRYGHGMIEKRSYSKDFFQQDSQPKKLNKRESEAKLIAAPLTSNFESKRKSKTLRKNNQDKQFRNEGDDPQYNHYAPQTIPMKFLPEKIDLSSSYSSNRPISEYNDETFLNNTQDNESMRDMSYKPALKHEDNKTKNQGKIKFHESTAALKTFRFRKLLSFFEGSNLSKYKGLLRNYIVEEFDPRTRKLVPLRKALYLNAMISFEKKSFELKTGSLNVEGGANNSYFYWFNEDFIDFKFTINKKFLRSINYLKTGLFKNKKRTFEIEYKSKIFLEKFLEDSESGDIFVFEEKVFCLYLEKEKVNILIMFRITIKPSFPRKGDLNNVFYFQKGDIKISLKAIAKTNAKSITEGFSGEEIRFLQKSENLWKTEFFGDLWANTR